MVVLSRIYVRQLSYLGLISVLATLLILIAHRQNVIDLENYLPSNISPPAFFQPPDNDYIIDIHVSTCNRLTSNKQSCGLPSDDGTPGKWVRIDKDLLLGNSWFTKKFFSYKVINSEYVDKKGKTNIIVDVAVVAEADKKIKGNENSKIPEKILRQFHTGKVFGEEDYQSLKGESSKSNSKRTTESDRNDLELKYTIPTKKELEGKGWVHKSDGIWVQYTSSSETLFVTAIDILFGTDAVDPRPNWKLLSGYLQNIGATHGKEPKLTIRKGPKIDFHSKEYRPELKFNGDGKFKILQVADLHFSTGEGICLDPEPKSTLKGCKADPRTLKFINKVLDIEKPDFVILTGDQVYGESAPDAETTIFKALQPYIKRKIPFASVLGNHDDEGSLSRSESMKVAADLPFSFGSLGPEDIPGVGNYVLKIKGSQSKYPALSLYFLDSHSYSRNPKVNPGYDWIKESQLKWVEQQAKELKSDIASYPLHHLSMAFFHIPLPEYRNLDNQPFIGEHREGITAPVYNTKAREVLGRIGVHAVSVGHDHANDYCLLDVQKSTGQDTQENKIWLCYGGGSGEGGYGGYGGYIRRLRVFEFDTKNGDIKTWKRPENDPEKDFDHQMLVAAGKVVNF